MTLLQVRKIYKMKPAPAPSPAMVFALHKPAGPTSFDVVHQAKRILGKSARKIGHFGTLDPFAEGLILVGTGGATKLADRFHQDFPKTYAATGKLGVQMDTGDNTGDILKTSPIHSTSLEKWQEIANSLVGEYWQAPPAFSATKHEGKALYEYARRGIVIEKDPVRREIYQLKVLSIENEFVHFEAQVSSGTYIRTLFEDMAKACDNIGHLIKLKRTQIGDLICPESHGELKSWNHETLESHWMPFDELLQLAVITLEGRDLELFSNGQCLTREQFAGHQGEVWVVKPDGDMMAMGTIENNVLKSSIMFPGGAPSRLLDKNLKLKLSL